MTNYLQILGFEGLYEVNRNGLIRNAKTMKQLKPRLDRDGYQLVSLWKGSPTKKYDFKVHRVVLSTFNPTGDTSLLVDHIDRVRTNNDLTNLRWADPTLNSKNRTPDVSGVRLRDRKNPWQAYCFINRKFRSLGHFATEIEARMVRSNFEKEHGYGNYSR